MAQDTINVTSASAAGGLGAITYTIVTDALSIAYCLPYEGLARIEVWVSSTNNRGAATKAGDAYVTALGTQYIVSGLGANVTRYAWFRAINVGGNVGDWYPSSDTAGISATTNNQVPPAGSVGPTQTGSNFSTVAALSANLGSITAGSLNAVTITGSTITGNTFQTAASGQRITITGSDNFIRVYNGSGVQVASLGEFTLISGWSSTILSVNIASANAAAAFQNTSTGPALVTQGQHWAQGSGDKAAFRITHETDADDAHGIWCDVGPISAQGGAAVFCTSQNAGSYAVYLNRGGIGPFTGQHPGILASDDEAQIGDILVDLRVLVRIDIDNTVTEVARSSAQKQSSVIGVLSKRVIGWSSRVLNFPPIMAHFEEDYDYAVINAVGEGQINVCGLGGDLMPGDYICTSAMPGKGQRQITTGGIADDLKRGFTVARSRERVTFSSPDAVKRVACIYECG